MKKILQKNEKVLHQVASEIPIKDIKTPKIKKVLKEMSESLKSQDDGVAIAAPQIGYKMRIFVVSGRILRAQSSRAGSLSDSAESALPLSPSACETPRSGNSALENLEDTSGTKSENIPDLVFINPKISKLSKEKEWMPEGCLSVRPLYGKTLRSKKATITAYDENGKKFTRGASGLLAQIFQHETDHLNGILFIEHAKDIKAEIPQK